MTNKLMIAIDPISPKFSVQLQLIKTLIAHLRNLYEVIIFSPYLPNETVQELQELNASVRVGKKNGLLLNRLLSLFGASNETTLWIEGWIRENILYRNSQELSSEIDASFPVKVLNLSMTNPVKSDVWWIQGPPIDHAIKNYSETSLPAKITRLLLGKILLHLEKRTLTKYKKNAKKKVTNSKHLESLYNAMGFNVDTTIYTTKDFSSFKPTTTAPSRDFVLVYLGKETDLEPIKDLIWNGVKIVAFGSKYISSRQYHEIRNQVLFKENISDKSLANLYTNALFTAFPFTDEPFGYVPVESMACGTPVLTYNKQGPSETVINGVTGWLTESKTAFVQCGVKLWKSRKTLLSPGDCIMRASQFSIERNIEKIIVLLEGAISE